MIPQFPEFKKLEFSDKSEIESHLKRFPTYSDFEFSSLWSWNVKDDMEISWLNSNLVIRFVDYLSGEYFFTFIGDCAVNGTVDALISESEARGYGNELHLLPEVSVEKLDADLYEVEESRDHFDYIFDVSRYLTYSGSKLKSRRNFLNNFSKTYPDYRVVKLDLTNPDTRKMITDLYRNWQDQKGFLSLSESFAYDRFLDVAGELPHSAVGIEVEPGKCIGVLISALPEGNTANGLFEKADTKYVGIYQVLMHEVAKDLLASGKKYLNYEQDLGIEGLRKAKLAYDPAYFLKKHTVRRKKGTGEKHS